MKQKGWQRIWWRDPGLGTKGEKPVASGAVRYFEAGHGEPVVFVHGAMVNANLWRKVVPRLEDKFHCVTLDLPFGSHEHGFPMVDLSLPGLAELVIDSLEELGLGDATIVANDTGGAVAQLVVAKRPDLVGRLVLTSSDAYAECPPPEYIPMKWIAKVPGGLLALLTPLRIRALRRLPVAYGLLTRRPIDHLAADTYALPAIVDAGVRYDLSKVLRGLQSRYTLAAAEDFGNFSRPVLIAWSREDRFCPLANAKRLAEDFPNARLEWIDDAFTLAPEDQPTRIAELVAHFIDSTAIGVARD
jgi:pimeloyl-ACP methyl ester carboxylesterase